MEGIEVLALEQANAEQPIEFTVAQVAILEKRYPCDRPRHVESPVGETCQTA